MTNDVIDQLENSISATSLGGEVSDELIAILRGDPDAKKDWERVKIEDISLKITSGGTPSTKHDEYYGGDIPWLRTQEVKFNYITETDIKITNEGLKNSSANWVPADTVVVAMYGESAGRSAYLCTPVTTNQACCNIVIDPKLCDSRYLFFVLQSSYTRLKGLATGGAQQNLNGLLIKSFEIDLPPLHIQKQIADLLSVFDKKIDLLRTQNKTLESIAQTIYKRWFVDFEFPMSKEDAQSLNKPELTGQPYKSSGGKMKPSELGDIPDNWKSGILSVFFTFPRVKEKDCTVKLPQVFLDNIEKNTGRIVGNINVASDRQAGLNFLKGDVLFGKLRPNLKKVTLVSFSGQCSPEIIVMRPKTTSINSRWWPLLFMDDRFNKALLLKSRGTKMPRVNARDIENSEGFVPTQRVLSDWFKFSNAVEVKRCHIEEIMVQLFELKISIMIQFAGAS